MLISFQLINFKSIVNYTPVQLTDYSILCGSNSSGKSSIIQALLMLSQTFSSRLSQGTIVLNGHLIRLGSFKDIKNHRAVDGNVILKFELSFRDKRKWGGELESISCEFCFGSSLLGDDEDELHPSVSKAAFKIRKRDGVVDELEFENPAFYSDPDSVLTNLYRVTRLNVAEEDAISKEFPDYKILGCEKAGFIPSEVLVEYDYTKKISSQVIESFIGSSHGRRSRYSHVNMADESKVFLPKAFFNRIKDLIDAERLGFKRTFEFPSDLKAIIEESIRLGNEVDLESIREQVLDLRFGITSDIVPDYFFGDELIAMSEWLLYLNTLEVDRRKSLVEFLDKHRATLQDAWYHSVKKERRNDRYRLRSFSTASIFLPVYFERSMKYLGPLRNEPQPSYPALGLADPTNVGMKGEFSAAILHINKARRIRYPSPDRSEKGGLSFRFVTASLDKACEDWLSYLGVVESVQTQDKGKFGYQLSVKTHSEDEWQDLTHVGVGVSQVLPLVLMSLLSEEDDILIFEQPELHLHPKIQSRLCDFFIAVSSWRRQCLIETHSEYLINRLRLRIVQSEGSNILDCSSIFFLNKVDGVTDFQTVDISEFGAIKEWPEDFFDQTDIEVENILLEATRKIKRVKREKV